MWSLKITFIGLDNEVWEVESALKQKQRELGHSSASYVIWNFMYLLWPLTFIIHFKVYQMCILDQPGGLIVILNQVVLK